MNRLGSKFVPLLNRRQALELAGAVSLGLTSVCLAEENSPATNEKPLEIIDTNIHLFRWPFRRLPLDETVKLVKKLRQFNITQAWAGSYEGLLHRDLSSVNRRLHQQCAEFPELIPIGTINPTLPGWQRDLEDCKTKLAMPGIRLYPNYHHYTLNDSFVSELLHRAESLGLFVQIAISMEDGRTQHRSLQVQDVNVSPLLELLGQFPNLPVQLLNAKLPASLTAQLAKLPNLFLDISRVDGSTGIPQLAEVFPLNRILFGSHAPFLIPEATLIRVHESGQFDNSELQAIYAANAVDLLKASRS
ncbi:amidohydrolase family protein [Rubinisphaera sp.]|uniref:amidohydrolase family protein n=1 Tax=Rubinisphaera sp. TaxID=2024857 RepID=UPI000C10E873|nr:amidohydrolase family protein [Rubinisphaera sp.]MBV12333.1 hypothetical protein [Rubinisphaera sp.]|tara:strand:+ start:156 stop:1064 length:909 start_codon:yes stop_codon:yes gene_type:complete